jgi:hypothetical protein
MQHWNLWTPLASDFVGLEAPAGTIDASAEPAAKLLHFGEGMGSAWTVAL